MKDNFEIKVETYHIADRGDKENVHQLPPEKLKVREVVHIDIAKDKVAATDYKLDEDPTKFKSEKTGRGPLISSNWQNEVCTVNLIQGVLFLFAVFEKGLKY